MEYRDLENKINGLLSKSKEVELSKHRLLNMGKSLNGEKLTDQTLTKPIVQTCIESIIVIDKYNILFVLPNNEKANFQLIKERRERLVQHTPVLEGILLIQEGLDQNTCTIKWCQCKQKEKPQFPTEVVEL